MGTVYAATAETRVGGLCAGTIVALKVLHPHLLEAPGFFKRFLREAEIGKSVLHDNVVRTLDCDQLVVDGKPQSFLVMEYVEGQTLRGLLDDLGRVPEELCRHVGREIAKGLAAIHAAGVVHRDLKPENVLITKDHRVKVMDLGVARLADESIRLSQSGAFVGSIEYAAPEQFGGKGADARTDLHALGLILYELSTAQHPYRADEFRRVMRRVLDEKPRRPAEINPQLSPFFEELVLQLLAKQPTERVASADEVARILDEGERSAWWKEKAKSIRATTKRPLRRIRIPRETALYGRDADLTKLRELFAKAKAGEGQVVLIEGEAGIGKSRLVDEFVGLLQREGEDVSFLFGSYPPGGAATASGAFSTAYREQFGEADLEETLKSYLTITPILVPAFAALLRGETTPVGAEPLTKDSLQTVFVHATRALAVERATIVLIDDLHFAPEEGRSLFAALSLAVGGHRVLLVGTTRPGADEKWVAGLDRAGAARMQLTRLGPKDLVRLLIDTLKSERVAEELVGKIALKSDGNPFFVFEILRGLREGQFLTKRDDGTWVTTRVIADIQVPSSVLDLVNARVADLDEDERNLLDVAACCGFEFDPLLVAAALGMAPIPAMQRLARIEKKHRLVRSAGRRLVFDHHQVQEALYGALLEPLREAYHAAIATAIEETHGATGKNPKDLDGAVCVDLAEHFLKGAQGARALRYLDAALTHLEKGYLNAHAVTLAERALALPGLLTHVDRAKALLRLCNAGGPLNRLGRRERQEEAAREAQRLAEAAADQRLCGEAAVALGAVLTLTFRYSEAEVCLRQADQIARARMDLQGEADAANALGLAFLWQRRHADARAEFERCIAIASATGDSARLGLAVGNLGIVFKQEDRFREAQEHFERSLAEGRGSGRPSSAAGTTVNLGNLLYEQGRLAEARLRLDEGIGICRMIGHREWERNALLVLGRVHRETGEAEPARECWLTALALSEALGDGHQAAHAHLDLGVLHGESGHVALARESFTRARDEASKVRKACAGTLARCHLACLPGGDVRDAAAALAANEEGLAPDERVESRWLLWKATGDSAHLAEAKRVLDATVVHVPDDVRESMLKNLRLNREIVAACKERGIE